jgi:ribosomal protein S18 acetylase RimI-like enzyme
MYRRLKRAEYPQVKALYTRSFDRSEDTNFEDAWSSRSKETSIGLWREDTLMAAAIVRGSFLEYIVVNESCRGSGIGTHLLQELVNRIPALHLTPVNDPRVIRWYESQGFCLVGKKGENLIYAVNDQANVSHVRRVQRPPAADAEGVACSYSFQTGLSSL